MVCVTEGKSLRASGGVLQRGRVGGPVVCVTEGKSRRASGVCHRGEESEGQWCVLHRGRVGGPVVCVTEGKSRRASGVCYCSHQLCSIYSAPFPHLL